MKRALLALVLGIALCGDSWDDEMHASYQRSGNIICHALHLGNAKANIEARASLEYPFSEGDDSAPIANVWRIPCERGWAHQVWQAER